MSKIQVIVETELTLEQATPIAELACLAFGSSGPALDERIAKALSAKGSQDPENVTCRRFVIMEGDRAVAHARTFVRGIKIDSIEVPVLALASVCTHPDFRGAGFGVEVTNKALEQIGQDAWPDVSLFQTPVAKFYEAAS